MSQYYVRFRGHVAGPHSTAQILKEWRSGKISGLHELSFDGSSWTPMSRMQVVADASGEERILDPASAAALRTASAAAAVAAASATTTAVASSQRPEPFPPPQAVQRAAGDTPAVTVDYSAQAHVPVGSENGLAVAGFVCSLVGIFIGIIALLGLVFSAIALGRPGRHGMATAGLVLGIIGVVGWVIVVAMQFR